MKKRLLARSSLHLQAILKQLTLNKLMLISKMVIAPLGSPSFASHVISLKEKHTFLRQAKAITSKT